jgi:nucleotide-binding universal stress UspA family protein
MFKRILIPSDGSALSKKAAKAGIAFAARNGARVVGYHALMRAPAHVYGEGWLADRTVLQELGKRSRESARKYVAAVGREAQRAGVVFEALVDEPRTPYEGIVAAARRRRCDLIFMASHGHRGLARVMLGSVADKVVQSSRVPVLVYR